MTYPNTVEEFLNPNLLAETRAILVDNGKTENDVLWVGNDTHKTTWEQFKAVADTEYNTNGMGYPEVATDLIVVGKDWWLTREQYDGSEWWEFRQYPQMPAEDIDLQVVTVHQAKELFGYQYAEGELLFMNQITG